MEVPQHPPGIEEGEEEEEEEESLEEEVAVDFKTLWYSLLHDTPSRARIRLHTPASRREPTTCPLRKQERKFKKLPTHPMRRRVPLCSPQTLSSGAEVCGLSALPSPTAWDLHRSSYV